MQTTACSRSEPCAMRLQLTLELFAKGSLAGRKTGLPAGGGGQFNARHLPAKRISAQRARNYTAMTRRVAPEI